MSLSSMGHGRHSNESCPAATHPCVWHTSMGHVTHVNESCHTSISQVIHINESSHTLQRVMSRGNSWTYMCVMTHWYVWRDSLMGVAWLIYEWMLSRTSMPSWHAYKYVAGASDLHSQAWHDLFKSWIYTLKIILKSLYTGALDFGRQFKVFRF